MSRNGELRVLQILSKYDLKTIFDIGANVGDWSILMISLQPKAIIHAFEIVPSTFDILKEKTAQIDQINVYNYGLSTSKGEVTVHLGADSDVATVFTLQSTSSHDQYYTSSVECEVNAGVDVMNELNIGKIDFMKIDTEGMDLRVIKGFESRLNDIDIIQFEYGIFNIASHDLLYDFYTYLRSHGFKLGKIFPRTVIFFDYHFDMENFHGGNFVAVKEHMTTIIDDLTAWSKPNR